MEQLTCSAGQQESEPIRFLDGDVGDTPTLWHII
jgi:hypothetical protein